MVGFERERGREEKVERREVKWRRGRWFMKVECERGERVRE